MDGTCLVVGLGNPGSEYARTRHNAGFLVLDRIRSRHGLEWREEKRFRARLAPWNLAAVRVWFCQPLTFMNASGEAVAKVAAYYRVKPERVLVVLDDANLELGSLRLRRGGGTGGHHGLESVEQHLGTSGYPRLRVGIGRRFPGQREITEHVLGRFAPAEQEWVERVLDRASDQIECWCRDGLERAMNEFNGRLDAGGASTK